MTFGLSTIKNENNKVIIDQNHLGLRIIHSGKVRGYHSTLSWENNSDSTTSNSLAETLTENGEGQRKLEYFVVPNPINENHILFIDCPLYTTLASFNRNNSNVVIHAYPRGMFPIDREDNNIPKLTYYHCSFDPPRKQSGWGLQIFNDNQELVFTSTEDYMQIIDVITYSQTNSSASIGSYKLALVYPITVPPYNIGSFTPIDDSDGEIVIGLAGLRRNSEKRFDWVTVAPAEAHDTAFDTSSFAIHTEGTILMGAVH